MKRIVTSLTFLLIIVLPLMVAVTGCGTNAATATGTTAPAVQLQVSAAASMTDALQAINTAYMKSHQNVTVKTNFASSGTLEKQIEQGAPVDVFISAAPSQMDTLQSEGLIDNATRRDLLTNKVVLVVPSNSSLNLTSFQDLTSDQVKKIAIGDWQSVPAGSYGKQALDQLGIFDQVQSKLILCIDVRQVLAYVEAGNVDAGLVYATDAAITNKVKIVAEAPDAVNSKILYPVAVVKASAHTAAAQAYVDYLSGPEASAIFRQYGFSPVSK